MMFLLVRAFLGEDTSLPLEVFLGLGSSDSARALAAFTAYFMNIASLVDRSKVRKAERKFFFCFFLSLINIIGSMLCLLDAVGACPASVHSFSRSLLFYTVFSIR